MSTKTVENERRKLTATFFNNIAVGCVLVALIGPWRREGIHTFSRLSLCILRAQHGC